MASIHTVTCRIIGLTSLVLMSLPIIASGQPKRPTKVKSPDGAIFVVIKDVGKDTSESLLTVSRADGTKLCSHDFSSPDGLQGYGAERAMWSRDGKFLAVKMSSSGGHSPMFAPIIIWNRKTNRLYTLKNFTGDTKFSLSATDLLSADTWPDLKEKRVHLRDLKASELKELACDHPR